MREIPACPPICLLSAGDIWMDPSLSGKVYIYTSGIADNYDSSATVLREELLGG